MEDLHLDTESGSGEKLTTNQGLPINDDQNSLKSGERGATRRVDGRAGIRSLFPRIHAEERRVLRNQVDFLHALADELAGLRHHALHRAAAMPAADLRDDAERTGMIAALRDFDVGEMFGREPEARSVVIGDPGGFPLDKRHRHMMLAAFLREDLLDDRCDGRHLIEADESVHLGQRVRQIF